MNKNSSNVRLYDYKERYEVVTKLYRQHNVTVSPQNMAGLVLMSDYSSQSKAHCNKMNIQYSASLIHHQLLSEFDAGIIDCKQQVNLLLIPRKLGSHLVAGMKNCLKEKMPGPLFKAIWCSLT